MLDTDSILKLCKFLKKFFHQILKIILNTLVKIPFIIYTSIEDPRAYKSNNLQNKTKQNKTKQNQDLVDKLF